jgi:hypothetical protein
MLKVKGVPCLSDGVGRGGGGREGLKAFEGGDGSRNIEWRDEELRFRF